MSSLTPQLIAPFKTGLVTDFEPWEIPPDGFQQTSNVHVHHGYLQKRSGYILFGTLSGGSRVMGFSRYVTSDGSKESLAFNKTAAFKYVSASHSYSTLQESTAAATTIFSGDNYDYIWSCNWQYSGSTNRLYFTNGKAWNGMADPNARDGIRYYPGSAGNDRTDLFNPLVHGSVRLYGSKLIFTLAQRLIVLYTYEDASTYPQRARWCAKQDPTNWIDTVAGGGGFSDAATGDQIISAQALQNQIIVFFTNSVWSLLPTGDPNKAFRWVRLNSFRACDGKMASVAYDRYSIGLGIRGITATDGSETQRIDQRIKNFTSDVINISEFKKVFCLRYYESQQWWTLFASEGSENSQILVYDDDSKSFTTFDLALNCLGYGNSSYDFGINDFTTANNLKESIDQYADETIQDYYFDEGEDIFLGGDINGNVYQLDIGNQDINTNVSSSFTTAAWNPFQSEGREAQMSYIDLYVDTDTLTNATVEFFKNDETSPYTSQDVSFIPNLNFISIIQNITQDNPCVVTSSQHGLTTGDTVYIYGSLYNNLGITDITQAATAVVTVNGIGELAENTQIIISDVSGMTEVNFDGSNTYTAVNISGNTFELEGINSSGYGAYTSGGSVKWGMEDINSGNGYTVTVIDENTFSLDGIDSSLYGPYLGGAKLYLKEFYQTKTWVRAYGGGIGYLHWVKITIQGGNEPFRFHALKPYFRPRGRRTIN